MALSTSSYFSNSIQGQPGLGADIDLYSSESNPKYAVGFGFTRGDGNKYRYCHFGALANRGNAVAKLVSETNVAKIENVGAVLTNRAKPEGNGILTNAIGSRYMQLVITATADQFAGGYVTVTTGAGAGFTYRIKGNTATSAGNPVTGNILTELYDPIQVAIDSNSDIVIAGSSYADLHPATTVTAGAATVVGVTVTNNTAGNFGWICTGGVIGALQDAAIGVYGKPVGLSTTTVGAITVLSSSVTASGFVVQQIGQLVEPASSTDYSIINLTLE